METDGPLFSKIVIHGGVVYLAGLTDTTVDDGEFAYMYFPFSCFLCKSHFLTTRIFIANPLRITINTIKRMVKQRIF